MLVVDNFYEVANKLIFWLTNTQLKISYKNKKVEELFSTR